MKIYSALGLELLDLIVDDKSYRYKVIMAENTMTLYFNMPEFHEIPEGSYCDFKNERYFLLDPENFKENHSRNFEYTLVLDSYQALLKNVKFKFFTMNGAVVDSPFELKFSLTATPRDFAQLLVNNMNISDPVGGWMVGECIDSDPVCLDFNHDWCFDVLAKTAEGFSTEWEFENKMLHIRRVEKMKDTPIPLKYGYNCGLIPGVSRSNASNAKIITRLFIEGNDRNIDKSTYGVSTLRMPKNYTVVYEGISYKTDATGTYIERVTPFSRLIEGSLDVIKVYPKRVGTVSAVNTVNADTNLYDVVDASIPGTLDFSQLVIAGETMSLIFQTGQLAGKEFEVKYIPSDKRFELVPLSESGMNYPSGSLVPEIGDKYAVFHVGLPSDYISAAEMDVLNEAVKYLWENEQPKYTYTGILDAIYAKRNWLVIGGFLNCGYFVALSDDKFLTTPISIRIVSVKEFINKPKEPEITLSNEVSGKTLGSELNKIPTQEQATDRKDTEVIRFAQRKFSDIKQTTEMLQSALLNFSGSISPLTVQTMQLIAGDETLQFEFVANSNSTASIPHSEIYNPTTKQFSSSVGILQHKTLGVTTLSSSHAASELKWWQMSAYISAVLDESAKSYYLYSKVSKTANTGIFLLSETAIALESVAGYYHLLMGILNSEYDGDRSYSQMYGYSELTPARITVKKVVSPSGQTFVDFENEVIQGNFKFQSGVTVDSAISTAKTDAISASATDATSKSNAAKQAAQDYADAQAELAEANAKAHADGIVTAEEQRAINDATTKANNAQAAAISAASLDATAKANFAKEYADGKVAVINQTITDLQTQADGEISNWTSDIQTEAPTLSNFPANLWTSDTIRDRHILDVYTNFQIYVDDATTPNSGKSWKFGKLNGVYSWALIADNNQSKAYLLAAKAQTTANRKVTTYNLIPNTVHSDDGFCYRKGDLWSLSAAWNGFTLGELLCASQDSISFVTAHWTKWVKYTDDTAVNNLVIGGTNLLDDSSYERIGSSEYLQAANLASVFDINGIGQYTFSFDLKSSIANSFNVYCNDRVYSLMKYSYEQKVLNVSTEYKRYSMTVIVTAATQSTDTCSLAFYSGYGSGAFPSVKNIQIEIGSKATGYRVSLADTKKAIKAAADAADAANALLADIASDNKLTSSEKQSILKEWREIDVEYYNIYDQAAAFGVYNGDYQYMYGTLYSYLFGGSSPLLSDLNTTSVIIGNDLRNSFSSYYAQRSNILTEISNTAKNLGDNAYSLASTAVANAANAQSAANVANTAISNISSDNVLSSVEKSAERNRWNQIFAEKFSIDSQATNFGITPEKTAYDNAFQSLANYLNAGAIWVSPFIPFWVTDSNLGVNTSIIGSTYRTNWETFYSAKVNLQNKIAAVAKASGDSAQSNLDKTVIGVKNLVLNSGFERASMGSVQYGVIMTPKNSYCGTIMAKSDRTIEFSLYFLDSVTGSFAKASCTLTTSYQQFSISGICPDWWSVNTGTLILYQSNGSIPIWTKEISVVIGNKPMISWIPATEDTDAAILVAKNAADTANAILADITNDNKLTPDEKKKLKPIFDSIISEYMKLYNQAVALGVADADLMYAGDHINDYLYPILANLETTSGIDGAYLRGLLSNYYNLSAIATNDISSAISNKAVAAQAKADALDNIKAALGSTTDVNGGLIATVLLRMKDLTGKINAGLSGLADNVSFWFGGTYEDALASATDPTRVAGIDRKDGSGHRAKGKLLWDKFGSLTVGLFKIVNGALTGYDGLYERMRIGTGAITPLSALNVGSGSWLREPTDYLIQSNSGGTIFQTYDGQTKERTSNNTSEVNLYGSLVIPVATNIKLYSGGALSHSIQGIPGITFTEISEYFTINGTVYIPTAGGLNIYLAAGSYPVIYTIEASYTTIDGVSANDYLSNATAAYITVQDVAPSRTEIGNNGLFSYWSALMYFYYDKINGLQVRGKIDIPVGLGGGTVTNAGVVSGIWGKIILGSQIVKSGNNYTINHNIGDMDYTVIPVADSANIPYRTSKSANSIVVVCAGGFDFILVRTK